MGSFNQRRHDRAVIRGVARVLRDDADGLLAVRDVAAEGLGLLGAVPLPPGARIELEMRVFGKALLVDGVVAWTSSGPHGAAGVRLASCAAFRELVDELEARLASRRRRGLALLVEDDRDRAALLAEYLWSHGYDVEDALTPLEAIERLEVDQIEMVAIGPQLSTCSGQEFAAFVAEHFPRVHRMVVAPPSSGCGGRAAADDAGRPVTDLHAVVCDDVGARPRRS